MKLAKVLPANLKRMRVLRGMSQTALAERVGVSLQTIWSYEKGVHLPQLETLEQLATALDIRPWQLLAEDGDGDAPSPDMVDLVEQLARKCKLKVGR